MNNLQQPPHMDIEKPMSFIWREWFYAVWIMLKTVWFDGTTATSATAGAGTALPATPAGYITIIINEVKYKVPYYNL